jgi:hypothetical protein
VSFTITVTAGLIADPAVVVPGCTPKASLLAVLAVTVMLVVSFNALKLSPVSVNCSLRPLWAVVGASRPLNVATPLTAVTISVPVNGPVPVCTVAVTVLLLSPVKTLLY